MRQAVEETVPEFFRVLVSRVSEVPEFQRKYRNEDEKVGELNQCERIQPL